MMNVIETNEENLLKRGEKLEDAIFRLNDETSTIDDYAKVIEGIDAYSDFYKDVNGIRPRGEMAAWYGVIWNNAPKLAQKWESMTEEERDRLRYNW